MTTNRNLLHKAAIRACWLRQGQSTQYKARLLLLIPQINQSNSTRLPILSPVFTTRRCRHQCKYTEVLSCPLPSHPRLLVDIRPRCNTIPRRPGGSNRQPRFYPSHSPPPFTRRAPPPTMPSRVPSSPTTISSSIETPSSPPTPKAVPSPPEPA